MLKKSLLRGVHGFCITVTITVFAGLITALCGAKHLCTPDFIARTGSEPLAFVLQTLLMGLIGFAFAAGSVFFDMERWSFLQQGAAHLALTMAVWIPAELICFSPITSTIAVTFALSAAGTYAVTWGVQYCLWRAQVRKLDAQIRIRNGEQAS